MDWITVIIALLIVGIVADGFRRVRKARREHLRVTRRAQELGGDKNARASSSEFPSGGPRVVTRREREEAENLNQDVKKKHESSKITVGAPKRTPEQTSLNLEEVVPMLMDSLESEEQEAVVAEDDDTPSLGDMEALDEQDEDVTVENASAKTREQKSRDKKFTEKKDKAAKPQAKDEGDEDAEPSEVLVVSVMAKAGKRIQGSDLLQALMEVHMKFGDMDIFHRYEDEDEDGKVYFSLANMVVPGTFNLAEMKEFSTPGVSLFMQLPLHPECEPLKAFDIFADTARKLSSNLNGELKDENRSVMTSQTFEHYRQRVIEFERRQKLQHS